MPALRIKHPTPQAPWPKPEGYVDLLADPRAITEHIACLSPGDIDEEMVEEHFRGCQARLAWVAIEHITPGHPDAHLAHPAREAQYARQPLQTMPPIVIDGGRIEDGHHRFRVARAAGVAGMWCYCVEAGVDE